MLNTLWNLMAVLGIVVCFVAFFVVICVAASPHDRREEDEEQVKFLKAYFNRKDDNND